MVLRDLWLWKRTRTRSMFMMKASFGLGPHNYQCFASMHCLGCNGLQIIACSVPQLCPCSVKRLFLQLNWFFLITTDIFSQHCLTDWKKTCTLRWENTVAVIRTKKQPTTHSSHQQMTFIIRFTTVSKYFSIKPLLYCLCLKVYSYIMENPSEAKFKYTKLPLLQQLSKFYYSYQMHGVWELKSW